MIGEEEFSKMKKDAVLVNTARGPVIDEEAFAAALKNRKIFYGGCDVFEKEPTVNKNLLDCPNAVLLPHIGSGTIETRTEMAKLVVNSVIEALHGKTPELTVNPEFLKNKSW
jgi:glyoxylate reductase